MKLVPDGCKHPDCFHCRFPDCMAPTICFPGESKANEEAEELEEVK